MKTVKMEQSTQNNTTPDDDQNMVENAWAEDMGQIFYHPDPDTRKITSSLEK